MFAPQAVVVPHFRCWIRNETLGTGARLEELRGVYLEKLRKERRGKTGDWRDILVAAIEAELGQPYRFSSFENGEMVFYGKGVELRLKPAGFHIRYMAVRASDGGRRVWRTDGGVSFGASKCEVVRAYGWPSLWFSDRLIYMQATGGSAWDALTVTFAEDGALEFRVNDNSIDGLSPPVARFMLIWTALLVVALVVYGWLLGVRLRG